MSANEGPSMWDLPESPPQAGDVWFDGVTHWTVRLDAAGRPEFFEPNGPGFVPAHDLPKFRGGMRLVSRGGAA